MLVVQLDIFVAPVEAIVTNTNETLTPTGGMYLLNQLWQQAAMITGIRCWMFSAGCPSCVVFCAAFIGITSLCMYVLGVVLSSIHVSLVHGY